MGLGSNTKIKFTGNKEDLDKIYELAYDGDEGWFYDKVMGVDSTKFSYEEEIAYKNKIGVNSLCQAYCSATKEDDGIVLNVYSTYDTPIGVWKKIAKDFPDVEAEGSVVREDDPEEREGVIEICEGKFYYIQPEKCK